jgi:hypothetical protein
MINPILLLKMKIFRLKTNNKLEMQISNIVLFSNKKIALVKMNKLIMSN